MISWCVITKDNEKTIANCINSVKEIVDEIIIVDNGSTDNTKQVAINLGAKVYDYEWNDNFSESKNFALSKAKGDWILALDADEVIAKMDLEKIKKLTEDNKFMAYSLIQRNYTNQIGSFSWVSTVNDKYEESKIASGFVPRKMARLFKNDSMIRFEGVVHDSVIKSIERINGVIGESDIVIHHFGLLNRSNEQTKRYIEIEKKNIKNDFFQEYQIASQLHSVGELSEALNHLTNSIQLNPDFYLSLLELAVISIKKGKVSEAKPLLIRSLQLQQHEMAWSHLGIVEAYEKNYENAVKCFEKAIEMNPKNADFHFNLANALSQSSKPENQERAKQEYEKAIYLNPDYKSKIKL